ncbi:mitochondrial ribonuclease P protein 1 homolog isoform X2 [Prorops nasuta]
MSKEEAQRKLDSLLIENVDLKQRKQLIELELDMMKHKRLGVPEVFTPNMWLEILHLKNFNQRRITYTFWFKKELKSSLDLKKKSQKKEERKQPELELNLPDHKYGLKNNTLFLRIYDQTIDSFHNGRVVSQIPFIPKIVFDCSYDEHMTLKELSSCVKQMVLSIKYNREHPSPLNIYLCNAIESSPLIQLLHQWIPTMYDCSFPLNITPKSYIDVFGKKNLVYLTPHCRNTLEAFDEDKVYIIGALVDKGNSLPLSLAKAKKEGIAMAALPLDKYMKFGSGSGKNLTLNQVISIMIDLRHTKDWLTALTHVPTRKLMAQREAKAKRNLSQFLLDATNNSKEIKPEITKLKELLQSYSRSNLRKHR